jgi:hypothetical protein
MRLPNETSFHLRMATLVIFSLFLEHLGRSRLPSWSSPAIGVVTFVLGMLWVGLFAWHHARVLHERIRVLEDRLDRVTRRTDEIEDERRARRSLPPR